MAEGRILSKRVTRSDKIAALSSDTERMIYSWLIPYLDVEGRMEANSRLLKSDIAPLLDHITIEILEKILTNLHNAELITVYEVKGKRYLQLIQFDEHQPNLRKDREKKSLVPPPPKEKKPVSVELRQNSGEAPAELPHKINISKDNISKEGTADAPFELPSKETINEASDPMISDQIEKICGQLYQEKIFPEVNAFKNTMLKKKKNSRSILHTLCRAYMKRTFDEGPWAYCEKIIQNESQNYNARDYEKTA